MEFRLPRWRLGVAHRASVAALTFRKLTGALEKVTAFGCVAKIGRQVRHKGIHGDWEAHRLHDEVVNEVARKLSNEHGESVASPCSASCELQVASRRRGVRPWLPFVVQLPGVSSKTTFGHLQQPAHRRTTEWLPIDAHVG